MLLADLLYHYYQIIWMQIRVNCRTPCTGYVATFLLEAMTVELCHNEKQAVSTNAYIRA